MTEPINDRRTGRAPAPHSRLGAQIAEVAAAVELETSLGTLRVVSAVTVRACLPSLPLAVEEDPYRALDDLMVAVEALCPVWPPRDIFRDGGKMLL